MIRKTMFVLTAVGGLGVGIVAAGPAADATNAPAAAQTTVTSAPPVTNTPRLIVKSRDPQAQLAAGDIFAGVKYDLGPPPDGSAIGPDIVDNRGRQVYFAQSPTTPAPGSTGAQRATDVKVQTYRGQRVLTFWQGGTGFGNPGVGAGSDYIYDQHYKLLRTIHAHGSEGGAPPLQADQHEFLLTPGGTAIIVAYGEKTINADPYRKAGDTSDRSHQKIFDCVIQEIDLDSASVVHEWHSLTHVSPARSHQPLPTDPTTGDPTPNAPWDYFHINSVKIDSDFNLIVSGRHTWAFYKVNRHTGAVMWQVQTGLTSGGKYTTGAQSNFRIGSGAAFSWQHDPEPLGNNEYRIFDNNSNQAIPPPAPAHVLTLKLDMAHHTATNLGHINYSPGGLVAGSQGNNQQLSASHVFIGWGAGGDITEVNAARQQIFDADFEGNGFNTYRAYKSVWVGTPSSPPTISMHGSGSSKKANVVWNGANQVARWRILSGSSPSTLASVGSTSWRGLDTGFRLSTWRAYVKAVALDSRGRVLGRTAAVHT